MVANRFGRVIVESVTSNPDVPSGETFVNVMRYCLVAEGPTSCSLVITGAVKFLKTCWIKGIVEKNSHDGAFSFVKELAVQMREYLMTRPASVLAQQPSGSKRWGALQSDVLPWGLQRYAVPLLLVLLGALVVNIRLYAQLSQVTSPSTLRSPVMFRTQHPWKFGNPEIDGYLESLLLQKSSLSPVDALEVSDSTIDTLVRKYMRVSSIRSRNGNCPAERSRLFAYENVCGESERQLQDFLHRNRKKD